MKFNSQICTTREQSERLMALGLKMETADMCWWVSPYLKEWTISTLIPFELGDLPAWSLHRLIEMALEYELICGISFAFNGDAYERVIRIIELQIKAGFFNKEFLV